MVIYLRHETHGEKVASEENEARFDESHGWKRYDPFSKIAPILTDDEIRAEWAAKFGKQPHHKKSVDSLKRELAQ